MGRRPLGRIPADAIRAVELPAVPADLVAGFRALADLTATVSDVLDGFGIVATVPARVLHPLVPGARLVGRAITVRNVERSEPVGAAVATRRNSMGDTEAYHLAEPGDVVVIEGLLDVSNMGGQGVQVAARQGCAGAVIDGSVRDPGAPAAHDFRVWARGVTPITGKWRAETVEINGRVRIGGVAVDAGDLVVADDAGVCFVPRERAGEVLAAARLIDEADARRSADIDAGVDIATLMATRYK